jgi:programmed cell death protein 5
MEEDIDEVKRRKLLELQQRLQEERIREEERRQLELQKRSILMTILTPEARGRLANIKIARPDFGAQIENLLIQLAQTGKIQQKITDEQLKNILAKISGKKREIKIRRI